MKGASDLDCRVIRDSRVIDAFADASPQGCFWNHAFWTRLMADVTGTAVEHLGCYRSDKLLAVCSVSVRRRWGFSIAQRPFATPYGGIFLAANLDDDPAACAAVALSDALLRRHHYVELTHHPAFRFADALARRGWVRTPRATMMLDISDTAALWNRLDCDLRNIIRKAERSSVTYAASEDTAAFYSLYRDTFRRRDVELSIGEEQIEALITALRQANCGALYLARDAASTPCAAAVVTWHGHMANYFLAASHPELRRNGSPSGLLWHIIQELTGRFREMDLVGANIPSIAQFKSQFRPTRVAYDSTARYRNAFRRAQHTWYRRLVGRRGGMSQ